MSIAEVQTPASKNTASGTSDTLAYGSNVTAGSLLVMAGRVGDIDGDKTWTVSDGVNGSWSRATGIYLAGHGELEVWYRPNSGAGAITVSLGITGSATSMRWSVHEYSGIATASPLDQVNTGSGASGNPSGYGVTTTQADELIFACVGTNVVLTLTAEASYTLRSQVPAAPNTRFGTEHQIVAATGTYNGNFTLSDTTASWIAAIATFKAAGAAAGITYPQLERLTRGANRGMPGRVLAPIGRKIWTPSFILPRHDAVNDGGRIVRAA